MPTFSFTDEQMLQGTVVTPAWYTVVIESIGEKPSKDQGSTNYPVEVKILRNADDGSEDFAGVPITYMFNSKALGFAIGFLKALGIEVAAGERYDMSQLAGQTVDIYIKNDLYQGRTVNRVDHQYRPAGSGK